MNKSQNEFNKDGPNSDFPSGIFTFQGSMALLCEKTIMDINLMVMLMLKIYPMPKCPV